MVNKLLSLKLDPNAGLQDGSGLFLGSGLGGDEGVASIERRAQQVHHVAAARFIR